MNPKTNLYLLGGGNPADARMTEHYRSIAELSRSGAANGRKPNIALLPTAHRNGTHPKLQMLGFIEEIFCSFACTTETILLGEVPAGQRETNSGEVDSILHGADALFVLGGDTRYMLDVLHEKELVPIFLKHLNTGLLFSGSSAGAIWLAELAMSDSESFSRPEGWNYIMLDGLGVLPFVMNVHHDQGVADGIAKKLLRRQHFEAFLSEHPERVALAIDEFVALEIHGTGCSVRSSGAERGAYILAHLDGEIRRMSLPSQTDLAGEESLIRDLRSA